MLSQLPEKTLRPNIIDAAVGARIRELRQSHDLSVNELAAELAIDSLHLECIEHGWERGHASLLFQVASHFGVPLSYFFR